MARIGPQGALTPVDEVLFRRPQYVDVEAGPRDSRTKGVSNTTEGGQQWTNAQIHQMGRHGESASSNGVSLLSLISSLGVKVGLSRESLRGQSSVCFASLSTLLVVVLKIKLARTREFFFFFKGQASANTSGGGFDTGRRTSARRRKLTVSSLGSFPAAPR
jgi:hypothetical protein